MTRHAHTRGIASHDGDMPTGARVRFALRCCDEAVTRIAWSRDGSMLAVPSRDRTISILDGASGEERTQLRGSAEAVLSVSWSPDGSRLASGAYDNRVLVWDVRAGAVLHALEGHAREVNSVAWSPSGDVLASSAEDGKVILWNARDDFRGHSVIANAGALHCAWSPDGRTLAVASEDGCVRVWDARTGNLMRTFGAGTEPVVMVAWHPDGVRVASASKDRTVRVWSVASNAIVRTLSGHTGQVIAVAVSADGALLASKARDDTVLLWRTDTWRPVAFIDEAVAASGWCVALGFHPTAPVLVSSGDNGRMLRAWDLDVESLATADVEALVSARMRARRRGALPADAELRRVVLR
jgi:dipeptidyl aminopeptidase/acylaminoacyl peptidase